MKFEYKQQDEVLKRNMAEFQADIQCANTGMIV